jgi:hypothetical protein
MFSNQIALSLALDDFMFAMGLSVVSMNWPQQVYTIID